MVLGRGGSASGVGMGYLPSGFTVLAGAFFTGVGLEADDGVL